MSKSTFALGTQYRDTISGFVGIAVIRTDHMNGRTTITLSAKVDEKGEIKHHDFDPERLVDVGSGSQIAVPKLGKQDVKFGTVYRDRHTGFEGKATQRGEHINGCIQWALDPKVNEKNELQRGYYFDDDRIMDPATETKVVSEPAPKGNANLRQS